MLTSVRVTFDDEIKTRDGVNDLARIFKFVLLYTAVWFYFKIHAYYIAGTTNCAANPIM